MREKRTKAAVDAERLDEFDEDATSIDEVIHVIDSKMYGYPDATARYRTVPNGIGRTKVEAQIKLKKGGQWLPYIQYIVSKSSGLGGPRPNDSTYHTEKAALTGIAKALEHLHTPRPEPTTWTIYQPPPEAADEDGAQGASNE